MNLPTPEPADAYDVRSCKLGTAEPRGTVCLYDGVVVVVPDRAVVAAQTRYRASRVVTAQAEAIVEPVHGDRPTEQLQQHGEREVEVGAVPPHAHPQRAARLGSRLGQGQHRHVVL